MYKWLALSFLFCACGSVEKDIAGIYITEFTNVSSGASSCHVDLLAPFSDSIAVSQAFEGVYDVMIRGENFYNVNISSGESTLLKTKTSPDYAMFFGDFDEAKVSGIFTIAKDGDYKLSTARCFIDFKVKGFK